MYDRALMKRIKNRLMGLRISNDVLKLKGSYFCENHEHYIGYNKGIENSITVFVDSIKKEDKKNASK